MTIGFFHFETWEYNVVNDNTIEEISGNVFTSFSERLDGGDILGDGWIIDTLNYDSQVRIISWETLMNRVVGEYTLTFVLPPDEDKINPANPDTVKLEDGKFWGKYE